MSPREELALWLEETRAWVDEELERFVPGEEAHPARLHRAMRHALLGGGKRLRPALVRVVCRELGGADEDAARPAVAVELVHTYSLVHDDLPCMDDDELRRGRATVHVAFDEATAILAGDALLTLAFEVLGGGSGAWRGELATVLARAAGPAGMVGGQVLDLTMDPPAEGSRPRLETILEMHGKKTAALFRAAAEMGAVAAGAAEEKRQHAAAFGHALGLLFQAVDDLLDVTGDSVTLGKTPGKDAVLERATLVSAVGLESGRKKAQELAGDALAAARDLSGASEGLLQDIVAYLRARQA